MINTLEKICADKQRRIAAQKSKISLEILKEKIAQQEKPRGFKLALQAKIRAGKPALIAEIKKASPSKGLIRADFDPATIAREYKAGGAACLSMLTDTPYFQGADEYLQAARAAVDLPVLRKDFMLDSYQIYESRALGADAILLIMAALSDAQASELELLAIDLGMDVLVEIHNREELERAISINSRNFAEGAGKMLGINNRNLKTLEVSLNTSKELAKFIPAAALGICESGIETNQHIKEMQEFGLNTFLVGESLMRKENIELATKELLSWTVQRTV